MRSDKFFCCFFHCFYIQRFLQWIDVFPLKYIFVPMESFKAIGAVKFQINPHYLDANPAGHAGETREQRILEYIEANPRRWVAGLREGCMLRCEDGKLELIGRRPMRMFRKGVETFEVEPGGDLSFLL